MIFFYCRLKYPWSCFSSDFCLLVFGCSCYLFVPKLFLIILLSLAAVSSLSLLFFVYCSSLWIVASTNCTIMANSFFLSFLDVQSVSLSAFKCRTFCVILLVLLALLIFLIINCELSTPALADVFFHSKSPRIFRTFLSILADLNNAIIWMVPVRVLISHSLAPLKSFGDCYKHTSYSWHHRYHSFLVLKQVPSTSLFFVFPGIHFVFHRGGKGHCWAGSLIFGNYH